MDNDQKEAEPVTCLHCYKQNVSGDHRCIWEVFDLLTQEIAELNEEKCGNSGYNFNRYYQRLKEEVLRQS